MSLPELPENPLTRAPLPEPSPPPSGPAPLAPWLAPLGLVVAFVAIVVVQILVFGIGAAAGADVTDTDDLPPGVVLPSILLQDVVFVLIPIAVAYGVSRPIRAEQFGVALTRFWPAVGWILALGFTYYVLTAIYAYALDIKPEENLPTQLGADESTVALVAVALLVCVGAPIAEEFFFRGFFFGSLRNWKGFWPAALISGILFGAIHASSAPAEVLPALALLGVVFAGLYQVTGSILPCIALHAINNGLAFGDERGWGAAGVIGAIVGSVLLSLALVLPFARRRGVPSQAPATT